MALLEGYFVAKTWTAVSSENTIWSPFQVAYGRVFCAFLTLRRGVRKTSHVMVGTQDYHGMGRVKRMGCVRSFGVWCCSVGYAEVFLVGK